MENLESLTEELINWTDEDADDTGNLLHRYFETTKLRHWCDVAAGGREAYALMFEEEVEAFSPLDAIIGGVAAQAAQGVWDAVADAFGLEAKYVELTLSHYVEVSPGEACPPPMTLEEFMTRYKKDKEMWENDTYFEEKLREDN